MPLKNKEKIISVHCGYFNIAVRARAQVKRKCASKPIQERGVLKLGSYVSRLVYT